MSNTSHHVRLETDELTILSVNSYIPMFGRWAALSISVYTRGRYDDHATLINFGLRPVSNRPSKVVMKQGWARVMSYEDEFDYSSMQASRFPMARLSIGDGGHQRMMEQEIAIPTMTGNILEFSYLADGGEDAGRTISNAILRKMESIVENIRQSVLSNLSGDFRKVFVEKLAKQYNQHTTKALDEFLASVNWKMLLMRSRCDDRTSDVVDFTLQNNQFVHHAIDYSGAVTINPYHPFGEHFHNAAREQRIYELQIAQDRQYAERTTAELTEANRIASELLLEVLGEKQAKQFADEGAISVTKNGYSFLIRPNQFVDCVDPKGGRASLCIHTAGLSCNPIDEVVLAALNIEHHFAEYMYKAIIFDSRGCRKPKRAA